MEKKKCRTCLEVKSLDAFHNHNNLLRLDCKFCFRKLERERRVKRLFKTDPEHANRVIKHQKEIEDRGVVPENHQWCVCCSKYKPHNSFSPHNFKNHGCCRECSSHNDIQRARLLKLKAIEYLGGKCDNCGFVGHYSSFDFHHKNHKEKEFNWNVARKKSWNKIILELNKCELLCRNCHSSFHCKLNNDGTLNSQYIPTNV